MNRLKILINASIVDRKPTGLGRYTLEVVNRLISISNNFLDYYIVTSVPEYFNINRGHILKIPKFTQPLYGKKAAFLRFVYSNFILHKLNSISLIYSPTHHGLFTSSVRQIITIHDLLPIRFKSIYSKESVAYFYYKMILPMLMRKSEKLIVPSEYTKFDVVNLGVSPDKITVIYNGISLKYNTSLSRSYFLKKYGITQEYILSVGTTSFPYKNAEGLIKAFSNILNRLDYELVFCGGRNKYLQDLKYLVQSLGIEKKVKFLSYLDDCDLYHLYKFSSIFVYPSTFEGFGIPPLEAMACGCPIVVSNVAALPEVCGDAAYYVDPYDVEDIARGIHTVLSDENLQKELVRKGFERVKLFSWEKSSKKLIEVIEEVLQN